MVRRSSLVIAYIIALIATLCSLYASDVLGLEPCKLCWYQRVFLFPIPILLFFIAFNNRLDVVAYILPLPILGALTASWHMSMHIYIYRINPSSLFCKGCSNISYIPVLSLISFLLILIFLSISLTRLRRIK